MHQPSRQGFTVLELLVVIAIMTLLSAIVLALLMDQRVRARDAVRVENLDQIALAIELYKLDNNGVPPGDEGVEYINGHHDWIPGLVPKYISSVASDPIDEDEFRFHYMRQGVNYEVLAFMEKHGNDATCNDGGPAGCGYYEKGPMFLTVYNPGASGWNLTASTSDPDPDPDPIPDPNPDPDPTPDPDPIPDPEPDPEPTIDTTGWKDCYASVNGTVVKQVLAEDRVACHRLVSEGTADCDMYNSYFNEGTNFLEQYFVTPSDRVSSEYCEKEVVTPEIVFSNVQVFTTSDSATITWTTDSPTKGLLQYGSSIQNSNMTVHSSTGVSNNHSVTITGLAAGEWFYNLKAVSYTYNKTVADWSYRMFIID